MAMQKFTTKIVEMMKYEKLFESQGGPIILSQVTFLFLVFIYLFIYKIKIPICLYKKDINILKLKFCKWDR